MSGTHDPGPSIQSHSLLSTDAMASVTDSNDLHKTEDRSTNSDMKRRRSKEEHDFSWEMDVVNSNKSYQLLVRSMIKFHKHLKMSGAIFNPPTVVWTGRSYIIDDINEILQYQSEYGATDEYVPIILSRFPGMKKLCGKHEMSDRLNIFREFYPDKFDFYPQTWNVHTDMNQINKLFDSKTRDKSQCYIIKTGGGCQGIGISLVFNLREIFNAIEYHTSLSKSDLVPLILQKYCNNPLLTRDGYKFDFRLYVVLKSLDPLEFYVCRDGLCRICTVKYHPVTRNNAHCTYMHFTNFHLNKDNRNSNRSSKSGSSSKSTRKSAMSSSSSTRKSLNTRRRRSSSDTFPSLSSATKNNTKSSKSSVDRPNRTGTSDRNHSRRKSKSTPSAPSVDETKPKSNQEKEKVIKRSVDEILFMIKDQYPSKFSIKSFWDQVDAIVHKTLVTLALPLKWYYAENFPVHASGQYEGSNCFHIIGFDILMDDEFRCFLLEINDAPSFSVDSQMDFSIKSSIMESTLQILGAFHNESAVEESLKHNIRDFIPSQSKRSSMTMADDGSSRESSPTLDSAKLESYISDLYSVEERETLQCRYKKYVFPLPPEEWYRDRNAIMGQSKHPRGHSNLYRIFEDPMINRIYCIYSTRYGYINATKFIQFCEDFNIPKFIGKCTRSHLDLLYREYQTKLCGKGGGELDLEGFAYVLLMLARKKQSRYKSYQKNILQVWMELIDHLYCMQKKVKKKKCLK